MLSLNHSLKNTGIFTIKAQVVVCSVATRWHYAEVSRIIVSVKRILSLLSKGAEGGGWRGREQKYKDDVKCARLVNSNEKYHIEGAVELDFQLKSQGILAAFFLSPSWICFYLYRVL